MVLADGRSIHHGGGGLDASALLASPSYAARRVANSKDVFLHSAAVSCSTAQRWPSDPCRGSTERSAIRWRSRNTAGRHGPGMVSGSHHSGDTRPDAATKVWDAHVRETAPTVLVCLRPPTMAAACRGSAASESRVAGGGREEGEDASSTQAAGGAQQT